MKIRTAALWMLAIALCAIPAMAADSEAPTVQGRVVDLTDVQGFDQLTILSTRGERMSIRLGGAGTCAGMLTNGDQVRVSLLEGTPGNGIPLALQMKIRRTGASYTFRNKVGDLDQQWAGTRARDGSCGGTPGSGCTTPDCPGTGTSRSGGGSGRGGHGTGGGHGGGGGQGGGGGGGGRGGGSGGGSCGGGR